MGKKYVPSGYQIIALPEISGNSISWNMGDENVPEEIQDLYDYVANHRFEKKPLLINCKISNSIVSGYIPFFLSDDGITAIGEINMIDVQRRFNIYLDLSSRDVTISLNTLE